MERDPVTVRTARRRGDVQFEWAFTARDRWAWAEPEVWTERMLEALERGVKGGRWHSLIDKVFSLENLRAAFARVKRNRGAAGVDHVSVAAFESQLEANLKKLHEDLRTGNYLPQAIKRRLIPKPGKKELRPLGIPTVRDRVVQTALRSVLEPIFEQDFAGHSYGFRPGRSCKDALRRVEALLKEGYTHVVDADIKSYFDCIPHDRLLSLVRQKIADGRVLHLIQQFLEQEVLEGLETWTPEAGSPQGAVISPLLSNIYLNPMDHWMAEAGFEVVRYADDLVVLCRSAVQAQAALETLQRWMTEAGLNLHPEKTCLIDYSAGEGLDFLGYHFQKTKRGHRHWPGKKSEKSLRQKVRAKTRRANGHSLECIIVALNPVLSGWYEYYKHCRNSSNFRALDGYIRMRLRSILRKRHGGKGPSRGADHQRWPNAYFTKHGLFSMAAAHALTIQSSPR